MEKWLDFCSWITLEPDLYRVSKPIPHLQMFTDLTHVVTLVANGARVKKRTLEGYLRNVAQIFAGVGADDPHLENLGKIYFHLYRQLCAYARAEPPSY